MNRNIKPYSHAGSVSRNTVTPDALTITASQAGRVADHLERASGERQSALDAAAQATTVRGILIEMQDPTHGGAPDNAIEGYWGDSIEQSLESGAEFEKKPDRQIAEWGAEFETVEQAVPGTGRGAVSGPATEKGGSESPEREAELDKEREPIDMDMGLELYAFPVRRCPENPGIRRSRQIRPEIEPVTGLRRRNTAVLSP